MRKLILFFLFLGISFSSFAQENDDDFDRWKMRFRVITVAPNPSASIGVIGGDAEISTAFVPEIDFTYFLDRNWALELILGTAKHDVNTVGSDLTAVGAGSSVDVDLGSVWLLPPTLTLQYHFEGESFHPYIGAGLNYTIFYNTDSGNTIRGVEYENSFGFASQLGFDYDLNDKWFLNFDAKYLLLNTDVTVDASNLLTGLSIPAEVDINPFIIGVGVGFKF